MLSNYYFSNTLGFRIVLLSYTNWALCAHVGFLWFHVLYLTRPKQKDAAFNHHFTKWWVLDPELSKTDWKRLATHLSVFFNVWLRVGKLLERFDYTFQNSKKPYQTEHLRDLAGHPQLRIVNNSLHLSGLSIGFA